MSTETRTEQREPGDEPATVEIANPRSWVGRNERQADGSIAKVGLSEYRWRDENDKLRMEMRFTFDRKPSDGVRQVMKENHIDFRWEEPQSDGGERDAIWHYGDKSKQGVRRNWTDVRNHAYSVYAKVVDKMVEEAKGQTQDQGIGF